MSLNSLAKAALVAAALSAPACANGTADGTDSPNGTATDCEIYMNESGVSELGSKGAVIEYCNANQSDPNKVQAATGSQVLTCIESVDSNNNLVMRDVECGESGLSQELDAVYANAEAYCVPGGVTLYCNGENPPEPTSESCEIVPAADAYYEVYTNTADVLAHCQNNTDPAQAYLTCLGLTTDGMDLEKLETSCSDPNLQNKLNKVLQNADPVNKGCVTTDADIVCEQE